jgi:hypothetical protein
MVMMPYDWPWPSPQLTGHAAFWHPTGRLAVSNRRRVSDFGSAAHLAVL